MPNSPIDLYDNVYADFASSAEAAVALRWHGARARHREALVAWEGEANFDGLQRFLCCTHMLSVERRLSRYAYLAEKPG
jgi:hypothetical protein